MVVTKIWALAEYCIEWNFVRRREHSIHRRRSRSRSMSSCEVPPCVYMSRREKSATNFVFLPKNPLWFWDCHLNSTDQPGRVCIPWRTYPARSRWRIGNSKQHEQIGMWQINQQYVRVLFYFNRFPPNQTSSMWEIECRCTLDLGFINDIFFSNSGYSSNLWHVDHKYNMHACNGISAYVRACT
jgi:hypothetical protein